MRLLLWPTIVLVAILPTASRAASPIDDLPVWSSLESCSGHIAWGDYDNDGDLDLACGACIFENLGGRLPLLPTWTGPGGGRPHWIDYDNDGWLELALAGLSRDVVIYDGFPNAPAVLQRIGARGNAAWADVNLDGYPDLAICSSEAITVFKNVQGRLDTTAAVTVSTIGATDVALGDLDNDGDPDLVAVGERVYGTALDRVFENTFGSGTFPYLADPETLGTVFEGNRRLSITLADIDGSNFLDILIATSSDLGDPSIRDGYSLFYLNNGVTFSERERFWKQTTYSFAVGDYDGSGQTAIFLGNGRKGVDDQLEDPAEGFLCPSSLCDQPVWRSRLLEETYHVRLGDIDNDGDLDVATASSPHRLYLTRRDGYFSNTSAAWSHILNQRHNKSVAVFDIDNDGYDDAIFGGDGFELLLHRGSENGFGPGIPLSSRRYDVTSMAWGDVNNDGRCDVACNSWEGVLIFHGRDSEPAIGPTPTQILPRVDAGTGTIVWGDYDNDGDIDLAAASVSGISIFENRGDSLLGTPSIVTSLPTRSIAWGDYDDDGDLDLACARDGAPNYLLMNVGGRLDSLPIWTSGPSRHSTSVAWCDVDFDGDLDLAFGNIGRSFNEFGYVRFEDAEPNTVYENLSGSISTQPTFQTRVQFFTTDIDFTDMDGDSYWDLVCANRGGEFKLELGIDSVPTNVYRNEFGVLADVPFTTVEYGPLLVDLGIGDGNGDGALDVALASAFDTSREPWEEPPSTATRNTVNTDISPKLPNTAARVRRLRIPNRIAPNLYEISYELVDRESDRVTLLPQYSVNHGAWHTMEEGPGGDGTIMLSASPSGVSHVFAWDTTRLVGTGHNVTIRLSPVHDSGTSGSFQRIVSSYKSIGHILPRRPSVGASTSAMDYGTLTIGETSSQSVTIHNTGSTDLVVNALRFSSVNFRASEAFADSVAKGLVILPPGRQAETDIIFDPTQAGEFDEQLLIDTNDPRVPSLAVSLAGRARAIAFSVAQAPGQLTPVGNDFNVVVIMQPGVSSDSATVFFRPGGSVDAMRHGPTALPTMSPDGADQYLLSIPRKGLSPLLAPDVHARALARGIEFVARVYNGDRYNESPSMLYRRLEVDDLPFPFDIPIEKHVMFSLPLEMEGTMVGALDELDLADDTRARLFGYYDGTRTSHNGYLPLPDVPQGLTAFELGRAYWVITRQNVGRLNPGPASGLSTPTDRPLIYELKPDFNMIGNPFAFRVNWDSVRVGGRSMRDARNDTLIGRLLDADGGVITTMEPFRGYWVKNRTPGTLRLAFPPTEARTLPANLDRSPRGPAPSWRLPLTVMSETSADPGGMVGMSPGAANGWDTLDTLDPPLAPGQSLSLYFPHDDWGRAAGSYASDVRSGYTSLAADRRLPDGLTMPGGGQVWFFDIAKNYAQSPTGDAVTLRIGGRESLPDGADIWLVDRQLRRQVDLKERDDYTFYLTTRPRVRDVEDARFALIVGASDFVNDRKQWLASPPEITRLHQNHPNPFNPSTVISFDLASDSRVEILIFDARGAKVRTLVNQQRPAGTHECTWDGINDNGRSVSSGVYFYRFRAGSTVETRRMVLLK